MSLPPVPSFRTLDNQFFIATGEHLLEESPGRGDHAPIPLEARIQREQKRQQRARGYQVVAAQIGSSTEKIPVKAGVINGAHYNHASRGLIEGQIFLYNFGKMVMELWPDGHEMPEKTPARTPVKLRAPWESVTGLDTMAEVAAALEGASRLRNGFRELLHRMPKEALFAELEEWREEAARAEEHLQAVLTEIESRGEN